MIGKIAIIDDNDSVRDSVRALLECYGYEVSEYPSAEDYICQPLMVDCLLVDHQMTGMTGLDFLEKRRKEGDATPAVIITGCTDPTVNRRATCLGIALLQKPVAAEDLLLAIEAPSTLTPEEREAPNEVP